MLPEWTLFYKDNSDMTTNACETNTGIDPVAARILAEEGNPQSAINRLVSQLHWEKQEAEQELDLCLRAQGVKDAYRTRRGQGHG